MRRIDRARNELLEPRHLAAAEERLAERRGTAEQVQHQPAVPAVVAKQRKIRVRAEVLPGVVALHEIRVNGPELVRERVVEVHAGDGLHHPAVAVAEPAAIYDLHLAAVRAAVLRDRNALVALDRAGHAGGPEQFLAEVAVDELVQVAEVLRELPGVRKGRRDQLDQGLGVVSRERGIRERRAQRLRVRRLRNPALRRDPQRLLLHPLQPALQRGVGAAVDQPREAALESAVEGHGSGGRARQVRGARSVAGQPSQARRCLGFDMSNRRATWQTNRLYEVPAQLTARSVNGRSRWNLSVVIQCFSLTGIGLAFDHLSQWWPCEPGNLQRNGPETTVMEP